MKPRLSGSYLLLETFSETSLGEVYKSLPMEGPQHLCYLHRLSDEIAKNPGSSTLILTHAQKWKSLKDLYALNLTGFGEAEGGLFYAFEYLQGRLLSDVLKRSLAEGIPLAPDQAVYIADRVATALVSLSTQGLFAGHLSPEQVLISFEGEVKILPCVLRDLQTTLLRESDTLGHYLSFLSPELREGKPSKAFFDKYSLGLILFEMLTREPFSTGQPDFDAAARLREAAGGIGMGDPVPASLMNILTKSLLPGEEGAYAQLDELKADLDALIISGEYSPTTFNIAFLMHSLFRGEDEAEAAKDKDLAATNRSAYKTAPAPPPAPKLEPSPARLPPAPARQPAQADAEFGLEPERSKKGLFIGMGVAAGVVVIALLVWMAFFKSKGASEADIKAQVEAQLKEEKAKLAAQQKALADQLQKAEEDKAALEKQLAGAKTADEKAKAEKALREAQQRIAEQQKQQAALAAQAAQSEQATATPPAPAKPSPQPASAQPPPEQPPSPPPVSPSPPAAPQEPPKQAEPAKKIQAGDFVEAWALDVKPKPLKEIRAEYTPLARQNKVEGVVYYEVTIDESGRATSAQILRGLNPDYGLHDAIVKNAMATKFSPALKEGLPVKTKVTFSLNYKMR